MNHALVNKANEFILTGFDLITVRSGGMADVYICESEFWGEVVAVKTLQERFVLDARHRMLFVRECHTWSLLGQHENLVGFKGIHLVQGARPLLILEYVESNLGSLLRQEFPLPKETILRIALNICDAMNYCAEVMPGIVHSDLKPANVMITGDLIAKVTDFGLVRCTLNPRSATAQGPVAFPDTARTQQGPAHGAGTPFYMSPEQIKGVKLEASSDVYSFGCILYEMLTGKALLTERSNTGQALSGIPFSNTGNKLYEIVESCIRRNPNERPSFRQLRNALAAVALSETGLNIPVPKGSPNSADFNIIMALIKLGDLHTAEKICLSTGSSSRPALDPKPMNFALGQIARRRGQAELAISYFEKALSDQTLVTLDGWILDNLAQAYSQMGDFKSSIEASKAAIKAQPGMAVPWHNLGMTYRNVGQIDEALKCFREARRISGEPTHFAALANLLTVARHHWTEAISELEIAMGSHPNVPDLHAEYARALVIGFSELLQQDHLVSPSRIDMLRQARVHVAKALELGYDEDKIAGVSESVEGMMGLIDKRAR